MWLGEDTELGQGTHSLKQRLLPGAGSLGECFDRLEAVIQQIDYTEFRRQPNQLGAGDAEHHSRKIILRSAKRR